MSLNALYEFAVFKINRVNRKELWLVENWIISGKKRHFSIKWTKQSHLDG